MARLKPEEAKELWADLKPYATDTETKNKGGKETTSEEYITKSDLKISELEKAKTSLENALAEQRKQLEDPVISRYLKHKSTCTNEHCIFDRAPSEVYDEGEKAGQREGYEIGKADGKKSITPDDLTVDLVGEFFKKRGILGVAKIEKDGEFKPFKGMKTGGK